MYLDVGPIAAVGALVLGECHSLWSTQSRTAASLQSWHLACLAPVQGLFGYGGGGWSFGECSGAVGPGLNVTIALAAADLLVLRWPAAWRCGGGC